MTDRFLRPAALLDRDGVLNQFLPGDYVRSPGQLHVLPGAAEAVRRLNVAGVPTILISNQQGVAKGLMTRDHLQRVDDALRTNLAESAGAHLDESYYCTHASADDCDCRKPRGGAIRRAAEKYGLDLSRSIFFGDTETDAQAARDAGVGAFALVLTGKHRSADTFGDHADFVAVDLASAVEWALPLLCQS